MKNKKSLMGIVSLLAAFMALSLPVRAADGSGDALNKQMEGILELAHAKALPLKASVQQNSQKAVQDNLDGELFLQELKEGKLSPDEYASLMAGLKDIANMKALIAAKPVPYPESMPKQR